MSPQSWCPSWVLGLALASGSGSVLAHAYLIKSSPPKNETVSAPGAVELHFTGAIEAALSQIKILDDAGKPLDTGKARIDLKDGKTLSVALPSLAAGTYTVDWKVVARDGHTTKGNYGFSVK